MRVILWVAAVLVFLVGITLFLFTEQTDRLFAWTIQSSLTAAFLGAAYWASCVLEVMAGRERWWANARTAVPAVILFTSLTLIVTLIHADRFHFGAPELITRAGTWFWAAVYLLVPIIMAVIAIRQRATPGGDPPTQAHLPSWVRALTSLNAVVMVLFGIALLLAPAQIAPMWPWALTPLTGRAIGAWLVGLGSAAAHIALENDLRRSHNVLVSSIVFAVLEGVALARYPGEFQWGQMQGWLYVFFLVSVGVAGLGGALQSRTLRDTI